MNELNRFAGFPEASLQFLAGLAENNNKAWFEAHKAEYQRELLVPSLVFVEMIGARLQTIAPDIRIDTGTNGCGNLMRIHRDTRFSQDKTPYKTAVSGLFWQGDGKKTECPAFGFQVNQEGMQLLAGLLLFTAVALTLPKPEGDGLVVGKDVPFYSLPWNDNPFYPGELKTTDGNLANWETGQIDPEATIYLKVITDQTGERIVEHILFDAHELAYTRDPILPKATDTIPYSFAIPEGAVGPLTVEVTLWYRLALQELVTYSLGLDVIVPPVVMEQTTAEIPLP